MVAGDHEMFALKGNITSLHVNCIHINSSVNDSLLFI